MKRPPTLSVSRLRRGLGATRTGLLLAVGAAAARRGERAWLVGGAVRDLLLGREIQDVDVVVEGDAGELGREVGGEQGAAARPHRAFGTVSLSLADGSRIDLASARRETYPRPAALPRVRPGSLLEDLRRRDFSINSIALALGPERPGTLVDPTGGRSDLERRLVRALHARSFLDDPTRAYRAIRFAGRLDFRIESMTARWMKAARGRSVFDRLSPERLRREVERLFAEPRWTSTSRLLGRHDLWTTLDPRLCAPAAGALTRLERLYAEFAGSADAPPPPPWVPVVALAAQHLPGWALRRLVARLRPARRETRELTLGGADARSILEGLRAGRRIRPSRVYGLCHGRTSTGLLLALLATRPGGVRRSLETYLERWQRVTPDVSGAELLRCGVAPGPAVARGLRAALVAKLDRGADRGEQLACARRAAREA